MTPIEFLYDFSSPNCYVAYYKLLEMTRGRGIEVRMVPLFLGGLFQITKDGPVPRGSNEYDYMVRNLERISRTMGIEFSFPHSTFPINSVKALRGSYFAELKGKTHDYASGVFREYWVKGTDISEANNLGRIAESTGLGRSEFLEFIEREDTKLRLRSDTNQAYERGVFGAPTYFVDGEMYWGTPEVLWFLTERLSQDKL
ncbi:MAG TPA: 2-hydroxychromene-2-carboxylate isomerase [Nitrososphaerales archaeon]|nr:2-hydroxychromene-2-carboxylate isomerase [Nitrososphaerales archaeon]